MAEPLLLTRDLRKSYGTLVQTPVLHGIDLQLEAGSFSSLIGPSGSGKTTLLNLIGLLDTPSAGELILDGVPVSGLSEPETARLRNRTLGFIFQFHHLLAQFTVLENVLMPHWIAAGKNGGTETDRARELLVRVGLEAQLQKPAGALSGGQQQRAAIARALLNRPRLVLADEPTGNLDTENTEAVFALLRSINREDGTAFLIVTHDRHIAAKSDRLVEMVDGRILRDTALTGAPEEWSAVAPDYCRLCGRREGAL